MTPDRLPLVGLVALTVALALPQSSQADPPLEVGRGDAGIQMSSASLAALEIMNARATRVFRAQPSPVVDAARVIHGGHFEVGARDPEQAARLFLSEFPDLMGLDPTWEPSLELRGDGRRAHVSFSRAGVPICRAEVIVLLDGTAVTGAVANLPPVADVLGPFLLTESEARFLSREVVLREQRRRGLSGSPAWNTARLERRFLATPSGLAPVYLVEERSSRHAEAYGLFIDARTGDCLRLLDLVHLGNGQYPFGKAAVPFETGSAGVTVFRNLKDALKGKAKKIKQGGVSLGVPAPVSLGKGTLLSRYADPWDASGSHVFAETLSYLFDPFGDAASADAFDQVNTLHEIEVFNKHLRKLTNAPLAIDFSLPIINNIPSQKPGSFFSFTTFPIDSHSVGYVGFFDLSATLGPAADIARDPTMVDHEYTHAWLACEGLAFEGELDDPSRAVGEAVADFFAATHHKDTVVGRYADMVFPGNGLSRDLHDDDHFPETTLNAILLNGNGLPEEHRNSEIFGSFLVDIRRELGKGKAENLLWNSLPIMPRDSSAVGFPTVTGGNALQATEAFFGECAASMLAVAESRKEHGAVIGAASARGIMNTPSGSLRACVDLEPLEKHRFTFYSSVVVPEAVQVFAFKALQGRTVSVTLAAAKKSDLLPGFSIAAASNSPNDIAFTQEVAVKKNGRIVKQKGVRLLGAGNAEYRVTVFSSNAGKGSYELTVDASNEAFEVVDPTLAVIVGGGQSATGPAGGPFTPSQLSFILRNTGDEPLIWSASTSNPWFVVSTVTGQLGPTGEDIVTVTIANASTGALGAGTYHGHVSFVNLTNGEGSTDVPLSIEVIELPEAGTLAVSPSTGFLSSGPEGGPFAPPGKVYTLTNIGQSPISWLASVAVAWASVSPASGVLNPGQQTTVTLGVVQSGPGGAASLSQGAYAGQLALTNTTNGNGNTNIPLTLDVTSLGTLAVSPTVPLSIAGPQGGPFAPLGESYTLSNTGQSSLGWTATPTIPWLSVSSGSGTLAAGQKVVVTAGVVSTGPGGAASLPVGTHFGSVNFSNSTSGKGGASIPVDLTVSTPGSLAVTPTSALSTAGPVGGPFSPASKVYTLTNTGQNSINWSATSSVGWAAVTLGSGTLAAGQQTTVTASIVQTGPGSAAGLPTGSHSGQILISNMTNGLGTTNIPLSLTVATPGALSVSPTTTFASSGPQGGPFSPSSGAYTLTNTGQSPVAWSATSTVAWVSLSASSGTLPAGQQVIVTATIVQSGPGGAASLAQGTHAGQIDFLNTTNGLGDTSIPAQLTVSGPGVLSVTPTSAFLSVGPTGGPFSPASQLYTLTNTGSLPLNWSLSFSGSWATATPASGTLAPSQQQVVTFALTTAVTTGLAENEYTGMLQFANLTNGLGTTSVAATLLVSDQPGVLTVSPTTPFSITGPTGGPFSPSQTTILLTNTGGKTLEWSAFTPQEFLGLSPERGSLLPGAQQAVSVTVLSTVASLATDCYPGLLMFMNHSLGGGDCSIPVHLTVGSPPPSTNPVYYIDFDGGSDTNSGTDPGHPWKHCPGDPDATGVPKSTSPTPGTRLIFKGGVHYRGTIGSWWAGTATDHVVFDGNTAGTFGTGQAIIDGSERLTNWTQVGPHLYSAPLPPGGDAFTPNLYAADVQLTLAQGPTPSVPLFYDALGDMRTVPPQNVTTSTLRDPSYLSGLPANFWQGAYIAIWAVPNAIHIKSITAFNPATSTLTFDTLQYGIYTNQDTYYAIINSTAFLDQPGEYVVDEAAGTVLLWPLDDNDIIGETVTASCRLHGFDLNGKSHVTIQGFRIIKHSATFSQWYDGVAILSHPSCALTDVKLLNNELAFNRSNCGHASIVLGDTTNSVIDSNYIHHNTNSKGVMTSSGAALTITGNSLHANGGTGLCLFGMADSFISDNLVTEHQAIHANGITLYLGCTNCTVTDNTVRGGHCALTYENSTNLFFAYNVLETTVDTYTTAGWGGNTYITFYNNVMANKNCKSLYDSNGDTTLTLKNNILDGCMIALSNKNNSHNIYTSLAWMQNPAALGTAESYITNKATIFVDPASSDYRLAPGSPAIDAGTDVGIAPVIHGATVDIGAFEYAP